MAILTARDRQTKAAKEKAAKDKAARTPARATVVKTLAKSAAPKNVKQGNVTKVEQLKNKSTLTTLKGGRKVQQVAGKTAYVTNKGAGKQSELSKRPNGTAAARKALAGRNAATAARTKKK